ELVLPLLNRADTALQRAAWTVITARPNWADAVVNFVRPWLADDELPEGRRELLHSALLAFCKDPAVQQAVAEALRQDRTAVAVRLLLLESIALMSLEQLPASWITELGHSLEHPQELIVRQAVATVRTRGVTGLEEVLVRVGREPQRSPEVRVAALAAAAPRIERPGAAVLTCL